jgi:hypothetical protein
MTTKFSNVLLSLIHLLLYLNLGVYQSIIQTTISDPGQIVTCHGEIDFSLDRLEHIVFPPSLGGVSSYHL